MNPRSHGRLLVVAVAARLPGWAEQACDDYVARMPRGYEVRRVAVKPEPRDTPRPVARARAAESQRIAAALPEGTRRVALDEHGRDLDTARFAAQLRRWLDEGAPTAFAVGGADGLDPDFTRGCEFVLRLSSLTLPHALAQVLLCEQLYRAATLLTGHPYHRA